MAAKNDNLLTLAQIKDLQKNYGAIETINPDSFAYEMLIAFLDSASDRLLKQLATADIKFLSALARNRLPKKA